MNKKKLENDDFAGSTYMPSEEPREPPADVQESFSAGSEPAGSEITVVDSIMGSGKTSWAIQFMNSSLVKKFLYISPYLDELDRVQDALNFPMEQPRNLGTGKSDHLHQLLSHGDSICATHELFKRITAEDVLLIEKQHYILILDEVLEVIEPIPMKKDDLRLLLESKALTIDENGYCVWSSEKEGYETRYDELKELCLLNRVVVHNNTFLLLQFPPDIWSAFKRVYVLTYMVEASVLYYYFQLYNYRINKASIKESAGKYELTDYHAEDTSKFADLIHIYDGSLNEIPYTLSKSSYLSAAAEKGGKGSRSIGLKIISNHLYSYLHNEMKAKNNDIMWTTFSDYARQLSRKGYTYKPLPEISPFVSFNARATNNYSGRHVLAFMLNIYPHPEIVSFFCEREIGIDREKYALAILLQWIWRSAIRNGEEISLYIPSERMRLILEKWLHDTNA